MALDGTYQGLLASISDEWLDDPSTTMDARSADFVRLFEADLRGRDWFKRLYSVDDNSGNPLTISAQGQELPLTVEKVTSIWPASGSISLQPLNLVTADGWRKLAESNLDVASGPATDAYVSYDPTFERGPLVYLWPPTFGDFELEYIKTIPALETAVTGFFARYPDLYLYGALLHSAPYLQNDERLATWQQLYDNAVNRITKEIQSRGAARRKVVLPRAF